MSLSSTWFQPSGICDVAAWARVQASQDCETIRQTAHQRPVAGFVCRHAHKQHGSEPNAAHNAPPVAHSDRGSRQPRPLTFTPEFQVEFVRIGAEIAVGTAVTFVQIAPRQIGLLGKRLGHCAESGGHRFEDFVLDLARGTLLTTAGHEIPLRRKSFQLLQLLVETVGQLTRPRWHLSGDLGRSRGQRRQHHSVHPRNTPSLGDKAQRIARTVPGRGYLTEVQVTKGDVVRVAPPVTAIAAAVGLPVRRASLLSCRHSTNLGGADDHVVYGITDDLTTEFPACPTFPSSRAIPRLNTREKLLT